MKCIKPSAYAINSQLSDLPTCHCPFEQSVSRSHAESLQVSTHNRRKKKMTRKINRPLPHSTSHTHTHILKNSATLGIYTIKCQKENHVLNLIYTHMSHRARGSPSAPRRKSAMSGGSNLSSGDTHIRQPSPPPPPPPRQLAILHARKVAYSPSD